MAVNIYGGRGVAARPNAWTRRQNQRRYPKLVDSLKKEWDMTFSLGRPTNHDEVTRILLLYLLLSNTVRLKRHAVK